VYNYNEQTQTNTIVKSKILAYIIEDFGVGIPESQLSDLFSPKFNKAHEEIYDSTGVGLQIIKKMLIDSKMNLI